MPDPSAVSPAMEDYLEAILALGGDAEAVRVTDIASRLRLSKASVTQALGGLRAVGLVTQEPYGQVWLTADGHEHALRVERRHRVLRSFLADVLGVRPAAADDEACRLEHSISQDTLDRLIRFLEDYRHE